MGDTLIGDLRLIRRGGYTPTLGVAKDRTRRRKRTAAQCMIRERDTDDVGRFIEEPH